jgi:protein tyrosine phosphatase (PTP) superfamily phosphohydrolase (DUF442 family)
MKGSGHRLAADSDCWITLPLAGSISQSNMNQAKKNDGFTDIVYARPDDEGDAGDADGDNPYTDRIAKDDRAVVPHCWQPS